MNLNIGIRDVIELLEERYGLFGRRLGSFILLFYTALIFIIPSVGLAIAIRKWLWPEQVSILDRETWEALGITIGLMIMVGVVILAVSCTRSWIRRRFGI